MYQPILFLVTVSELQDDFTALDFRPRPNSANQDWFALCICVYENGYQLV